MCTLQLLVQLSCAIIPLDQLVTSVTERQIVYIVLSLMLLQFPFIVISFYFGLALCCFTYSSIFQSQSFPFLMTLKLLAILACEFPR